MAFAHEPNSAAGPTPAAPDRKPAAPDGHARAARAEVSAQNLERAVATGEQAHDELAAAAAHDDADRWDTAASQLDAALDASDDLARRAHAATTSAPATATPSRAPATGTPLAERRQCLATRARPPRPTAAWPKLAAEPALLAILRRPREAAVRAHFDAIERDLRPLLGGLPLADARALITRLDRPASGDPLARAFDQLSAVRRGPLLAPVRDRARVALFAAHVEPRCTSHPPTALDRLALEPATSEAHPEADDDYPISTPSTFDSRPTTTTAFARSEGEKVHDDRLVNAEHWFREFADELSQDLRLVLKRAAIPTQHPRVEWDHPGQLLDALELLDVAQLGPSLDCVMGSARRRALIDQFRVIQAPEKLHEHSDAEVFAQAVGNPFAMLADDLVGEVPTQLVDPGTVGPTTYDPRVPLALAGPVADAIADALVRLTPRLVGAMDATTTSGATTAVDAATLLTSHPLDHAIVRALCAPDVATVISKEAAVAAVPLDGLAPVRAAAARVAVAHACDRVEAPTTLRPVSWQPLPGTDSGHGVIEITQPADVTAEEVASALLGGTDQAYRVSLALPYAALAAPGEPARDPLELLLTGPARAAAERAQASRLPGGPMPRRPLTAKARTELVARQADLGERCHRLLGLIQDQAARFGEGHGLDLAKVATAPDPATDVDRILDLRLLDHQHALLDTIVGELDNLLALCGLPLGQAAVAAPPATPPPAAVPVAQAFVATARIADLPETAGARLDDAQRQLRRFAFDQKATALLSDGPTGTQDLRTAGDDGVDSGRSLGRQREELGDRLLRARGGAVTPAEANATTVALIDHQVETYFAQIGACLVGETQRLAGARSWLALDDVDRAWLALIALERQVGQMLAAWRAAPTPEERRAHAQRLKDYCDDEVENARQLAEKALEKNARWQEVLNLFKALAITIVSGGIASVAAAGIFVVIAGESAEVAALGVGVEAAAGAGATTGTEAAAVAEATASAEGAEASEAAGGGRAARIAKATRVSGVTRAVVSNVGNAVIGKDPRKGWGRTALEAGLGYGQGLAAGKLISCLVSERFSRTLLGKLTSLASETAVFTLEQAAASNLEHRGSSGWRELVEAFATNLSSSLAAVGAERAHLEDQLVGWAARTRYDARLQQLAVKTARTGDHETTTELLEVDRAATDEQIAACTSELGEVREHSPEAAVLNRVIAAAKAYRASLLELRLRLVAGVDRTQSGEVTGSPARIREYLRLGHELGMELSQTRAANGDLIITVGSEGGRAIVPASEATPPPAAELAIFVALDRDRFTASHREIVEALGALEARGATVAASCSGSGYPEFSVTVDGTTFEVVMQGKARGGEVAAPRTLAELAGNRAYAEGAVRLSKLQEASLAAELERRATIRVPRLCIGTELAGTMAAGSATRPPAGPSDVPGDVLYLRGEPGPVTSGPVREVGQPAHAISSDALPVAAQTLHGVLPTTADLSRARDVGRFESNALAYDARVTSIKRLPGGRGARYEVHIERATSGTTREQIVLCDEIDGALGLGPANFEPLAKLTSPETLAALHAKGVVVAASDPGFTDKLPAGARHIFVHTASPSGAWAAESIVKLHPDATVDLYGSPAPGSTQAGRFAELTQELKADPEGPRAKQLEGELFEMTRAKGERNRKPGAGYNHERIAQKYGAPDQIEPAPDGGVLIHIDGRVVHYDAMVSSYGQAPEEALAPLLGKGAQRRRDGSLRDVLRRGSTRLVPVLDRDGALIGVESADGSLRLVGGASASPALERWMEPAARRRFRAGLRKVARPGEVSEASVGVAGGIEAQRGRIARANEARGARDFRLDETRRITVDVTNEAQTIKDLRAFVQADRNLGPTSVAIHRLAEGPNDRAYEVIIGDPAHPTERFELRIFATTEEARAEISGRAELAKLEGAPATSEERGMTELDGPGGAGAAMVMTVRPKGETLPALAAQLPRGEGRAAYVEMLAARVETIAEALARAHRATRTKAPRESGTFGERVDAVGGLVTEVTPELGAAAGAALLYLAERRNEVMSNDVWLSGDLGVSSLDQFVFDAEGNVQLTRVGGLAASKSLADEYVGCGAADVARVANRLEELPGLSDAERRALQHDLLAAYDAALTGHGRPLRRGPQVIRAAVEAQHEFFRLVASLEDLRAAIATRDLAAYQTAQLAIVERLGLDAKLEGGLPPAPWHVVPGARMDEGQDPDAKRLK